jgi:hypothetical protein
MKDYDALDRAEAECERVDSMEGELDRALTTLANIAELCDCAGKHVNVEDVRALLAGKSMKDLVGG